MTRVRPPLRDDAARNALVEQFQYLPKHVAEKCFHRYPEVRRMGLDDAIGVGRLFLVRAAAMWDASRGAKFITYAFRAIALEIRKAALTGTLIHVPIYRFNPKSAQNRGKARRDVNRAFRCQFVPKFGERDEGGKSWAPEPLAPESPCVLEAEEKRASVEAALRKLLPQWRVIIRLHFGLGGRPPMTLEAIGKKVGLTKERVRQIEKKALSRLEKLLAAHA